MSIDMYRDGGTRIVRVGVAVIYFDNKIGSKLRGKGVYVKDFGTPVAREDVARVCEVVRADMDNWRYKDEHIKYVEEFLVRLETDYDSVYSIEQPKKVPTPASKDPNYSRMDGIYATLGMLDQQCVAIVGVAKDMGIIVVREGDKIAVYIPKTLRDPALPSTFSIPKFKGFARITHLVGLTMYLMPEADVLHVIHWVHEVIQATHKAKHINSGPDYTTNSKGFDHDAE